MPSRYLVSPQSAAILRSLSSERGGSDTDPRGAREESLWREHPPFTVRVFEVPGVGRVVRCYVPNRAGIVKMNGVNAQTSLVFSDGWAHLGAFGGVQTIVYLELSWASAGTQLNWTLVARTSNVTPSGAGLTLPAVMIARVAASGVVSQIHAGGLTLTTHYLVASSTTATQLLAKDGTLVATIEPTSFSPAVPLVMAGGAELPAGATIDLKGTVKVNGVTYSPVQVRDINGNTVTVLAH